MQDKMEEFLQRVRSSTAGSEFDHNPRSEFHPAVEPLRRAIFDIILLGSLVQTLGRGPTQLLGLFGIPPRPILRRDRVAPPISNKHIMLKLAASKHANTRFINYTFASKRNLPTRGLVI